MGFPLERMQAQAWAIHLPGMSRYVQHGQNQVQACGMFRLNFACAARVKKHGETFVLEALNHTGLSVTEWVTLCNLLGYGFLSPDGARRGMPSTRSTTNGR